MENTEWNPWDEVQEEQREQLPVEKKRKPWKRGAAWALCAVMAAGLLGTGFLVGRLTIDEEMRTLLRVKREIQKEYYQEVTDEEFYDALFYAVNNNVLDAYSQYLSAEEFDAVTESATGRTSGLGVVINKSDLCILRVCGNSPAERAGIRVGSYIVGFGLTEETIQQSSDHATFSAFLNGVEDGIPFYLLLKEGETLSIKSATRENYVENYVFYRSKDTSYGFTGNKATTLTERSDALACLNADTAYIRLTQFNGSAAEQFHGAMSQFKTENKKHLVLDLRGNGGGYLNIMREIASYFCKGSEKEKPVVAVADYGEKKDEFKAYENVYDEYFSAESRICVLADRSTASASECLIGCMVDYGTTAYGDICLFTVDGTAKTFGKGIMQNTYPLQILKGNAIKLTTAEIRWPLSGHSIHGRGILPEDGTKVAQNNGSEEEGIAEAVAKLFPTA
ncbi:MAG: hypothetical protein IJV85_00110 [Clostridia bacterium]|nr:hypothetical protein [Clostridia bacterium]